MVQRLQPGAKIGKDVERVLEAKLRNLDQSEEITKKYGRFQRLSDARMISVYPGFTPFDRFYFEATAHFDKGQTRVHCDFYKGESVSIGSLDMHESQGGHLIYCWATHPEYQGPKTYPVSGTVSLEGRLLEEGDIYFYPLDPNISADAGKIKAGQFAFRTKEGKKRVEIRASRVVPGKQTPMGGPMRVESLPPRYNAQTTLTAEVLVKGDNRFEFPLESDK